MRKIKVTAGVLNISQGARLILSKEQALPRAHNLELVPGDVEGLWVASAPLQFKVGEEISVTDVAKGHLDQVEFLDAPAAVDEGAAKQTAFATAPAGRATRATARK